MKEAKRKVNQCGICHKYFTRPYTLNRHIGEIHKASDKKCDKCDEVLLQTKFHNCGESMRISLKRKRKSINDDLCEMNKSKKIRSESKKCDNCDEVVTQTKFHKCGESSRSCLKRRRNSQNDELLELNKSKKIRYEEEIKKLENEIKERQKRVEELKTNNNESSRKKQTKACNNNNEEIIEINDDSEMVNAANISQEVSTHSENDDLHSNEDDHDGLDGRLFKICECEKVCGDEKDYENHLKTPEHRTDFINKLKLDNVKLQNFAFDCNIVSYRIQFDNEEENVKDFAFRLEDCKETIKNLIDFEIRSKLNIRAQIEINSTYMSAKLMSNSDNSNDELDHEFQVKPVNFKTKNCIITRNTDFDEYFKEQKDNILMEEETFEIQGSGWSLVSIDSIVLSIGKYNPLGGGGSYIPLPQEIMRKKAIINPKNTNDQLCFLYSVLMHTHRPTNNPNLVAFYRAYLHELKYQSLQFPLAEADISLFEKLNPSYSINCFEAQRIKTSNYSSNYRIEIVRVAKKIREKHVNLFLITKGKKKHYCYIQDLSRLLSNQFSANNHKIFICDSCLCRFSTEEAKKDHAGNCLKRKVILPIENSILKFNQEQKMMKTYFTIYGDIECLLKKEAFSEELSRTHEHVPCSYAYKIVSHCEAANGDVRLTKLRLYRGENSMKHLVENLRSDVKYISEKYLLKNLKMKMTENEEIQYQASTNCFLCNRKFPIIVTKENKKFQKVRDHDHLTSRYRGPACASCNLKYQVPKFVPIFFHNLTNYDGSCFIRELAKFPNDQLTCVPLTKSKYLSFSQKLTLFDKDAKPKRVEMRFLDSYRFLSSSLSSLASSLAREDFKLMRNAFRDENKFNLLLRKGIFPYNWLDKTEKFDVECLPEKEEFFNELKNEHVSNEDYEHCKNVFNTFNCANMGEFADIYLTTDCLLLADIFERFRELGLTVYGLDPTAFYTAASFSWSAMLKYTGIELELLSDIEMFDFVNEGLRGGITVCNTKHALANNIHMKTFDKDKAPASIEYFDSNNLYGYAMNQSLPIKNFKFLSQHEINESLNEILMGNDEDRKGYILEVDIETPTYLHDEHNDLPFLAESKLPPNGRFKKLLLDFAPKIKYKILAKNLRQALDNGLILRKVHRILSFEQSAWLKKYIDLNNDQRTEAKTDFEKDFFKLLNNTIFGKSMMRKQNHHQVYLSTSWEATGKKNCARKLIAKPNFHSLAIFDENFVAIQMNPLRVVLDVPIYLGFCILEESKHKMYEFFYNYLKPKFSKLEKKLELLYCDTDAYIIKVETDDFKRDIKPDLAQYFDTSGFDEEKRKKYDYPNINKKKLAFFKDEMNGNNIIEYIGLKAKSYVVRIDVNDKEKILKKNKGTSTKDFTLDSYKRTLNTKQPVYTTVNRIQSKLHKLYTIKESKKALTFYDDKRFQIKDSVNTLAWHHVDSPFFDHETESVN